MNNYGPRIIFVFVLHHWSELKIQIGGKDMESRGPKRRKDKYNPYEICEKNGKYYISFKSNEEIQNCIEIERTLYDEFNSFELQDLSHMNVVDRHLEIQRRRLIKYYFEEMTYEQIAQEEGCSFRRVAKSVKAAIENLKKILN